jgi:hypothetical protein
MMCTVLRKECDGEVFPGWIVAVTSVIVVIYTPISGHKYLNIVASVHFRPSID